MIFIAALAERTKHIKLGTGVVSLPYHNPLMIADDLLQLDHMTRGRVMLGVGPGALTSDAVQMGIEPTTQRQRMAEAFDAIVRLARDDEPVLDRDRLVLAHRGPPANGLVLRPRIPNSPSP